MRSFHFEDRHLSSRSNTKSQRPLPLFNNLSNYNNYIRCRGMNYDDPILFLFSLEVTCHELISVTFKKKSFIWQDASGLNRARNDVRAHARSVSALACEPWDLRSPWETKLLSFRVLPGVLIEWARKLATMSKGLIEIEPHLELPHGNYCYQSEKDLVRVNNQFDHAWRETCSSSLVVQTIFDVTPCEVEKCENWRLWSRGGW